ncbi:Uncharacterised protein [Vibrio cholerae]|nr:Uncharacterised protein [Vibrio cholerae]
MMRSRSASSYSLLSASNQDWIGSGRSKSFFRRSSNPLISHISSRDCGGMYSSITAFSTSSRFCAIMSLMSSALISSSRSS